ncbi:helix-turn-helix transcriptional regulator [Halomonas mongoliensis]|uniref:Helix-turn-helix transcriptional regulator n=1 Tax=Halomonas mongoliensis TaxID=321265 RepID=A0ABU1GMY3_9GAMM|nr:helix-turn-helix transcriptional regulator [Halomonas mongoliensis]MDR5893390.1 helix-turn-helix transcriptional regulator [Halomonas mongoliensis]
MSLHDELKRRRRELGFTQATVAERVGMTRQQYQRLEAGGNPRLDTLELAADGLNARLMLIPIDKWYQVQALLEEGEGGSVPLDEDPWQGLLDREE